MRPYPLLLILCAACAPPAWTPALPPSISGTGRVAVEGGTLYYDSRGAGPAVVLLHGGGMDLTSWDAQADALAGGFRVIRFDARGHGRSAAPSGLSSPADDLGRVLDQLGVRRGTLVGLSAGGGAALDFAVAHPERVERLVLVSPGGVALADPAGRARLGALRMPRLLVVGERDSADVLAVAEAVRKEAPEVEVVSLPGAAHLANQDAPEAFNQLLLRFLGG